MNKHAINSAFKGAAPKRITIIIGILLFSSIINSQKIQKHNKASISTYLNTPFDLELTKIPLNFKGHDPVAIYNDLSKSNDNLTKGEFETTAQYKERMKIAETNKTSFSIDMNLGFSIDLSNPTFRYNADNQELELAIRFDHYKNSNESTWGDSRKSIEIFSKTIKESRYNGINAFGVSKEIYKSETINFSLLVENWRNFVNGGQSDDLIKFKIKVTPAIAKQIKNENILSCIYIGKTINPYTSKGFYNSGPPTLSNAYEFTEYIKYINLNLNEIWIYNKQTGEIYARLKPQLKIGCDLKYKIENRKLTGNTPTLDTSNIFEEGIITANVNVSSSGKKVIVTSITSPTISDRSILFEAKLLIEGLKFEAKKDQNDVQIEMNNILAGTNDGYSHGTVTLWFKRGFSSQEEIIESDTITNKFKFPY